MKNTSILSENVRILLDMDEVLVDFIGGALQVHGWTREELDAVHNGEHWSITESMRLTLEEFWEPIHAKGWEFWMELQLTPWIEELLDWTDSVTDDWFVVTSPSRSVNSRVGKWKWLKRYLGNRLISFVLHNTSIYLRATEMSC